MLFTVSTVKDTLPNLQRFVEGNLKGGVDHMFVFLDAPDREVRAFLDAHPHVTCVRTDKTWWRGERPAELNARQRLNANAVKVLLTALPEAEWVFHIDGDEMVRVDREVLAAVPADVEAVRLAPLEAVSRKRWDSDPTWFKRKLDKPDLVLLSTLGVIDRPHNAAYFHGHLNGKSGVRPRLDRWLTLHDVVDADREMVDSYRHEGLTLLHYESFSGEEFVRKWTAMLAAGPKFGLRRGRESTALAVRTLVSKDLTEEQAAPYLMRIFERTTEDDFETLRDLGLLVEVDPRAGGHQPQPFPPGAHERLEELLERLRAEPKALLRPGQPTAVVEGLLERITGGSSGGERVRGGRSFLRRS